MFVRTDRDFGAEDRVPPRGSLVQNAFRRDREKDRFRAENSGKTPRAPVGPKGVHKTKTGKTRDRLRSQGEGARSRFPTWAMFKKTFYNDTISRIRDKSYVYNRYNCNNIIKLLCHNIVFTNCSQN